MLKFGTDVLGVAPETIGALWLGSHVCHALLEPAVGVLSDRTSGRWGRRRPWILAGAAPLAIGLAMMFGPPAQLDEHSRVLWLGVALVAYYVGVSLVDVPHSALGAELSADYHERTLVFGVRRSLFGVGSLAAVGVILWMERAPDPRSAGLLAGWLGAVLCAVLVPWTALAVRERVRTQVRTATALLPLMLALLRNPHARVLLGAFAVQQVGINIVAASLPFLSDYALGTPGWTALYLGTLLVASLLGVPLWLRVAPGLEKVALVRASMAGVLLVILALVAAPQGSVAYALCLFALGGLASAGMDVVGPSLQADVIDWDELHSGQRSEGVYFALWALVQTSAVALAGALTGFALSWMGFVPNAVQSADTQLALRVWSALVPALLFGAGLLLFLRFRLSSAEHARMRAQIEARGPR